MGLREKESERRPHRIVSPQHTWGLTIKKECSFTEHRESRQSILSSIFNDRMASSYLNVLTNISHFQNIDMLLDDEIFSNEDIWLLLIECCDAKTLNKLLPMLNEFVKSAYYEKGADHPHGQAFKEQVEDSGDVEQGIHSKLLPETAHGKGDAISDAKSSTKKKVWLARLAQRKIIEILHRSTSEDTKFSRWLVMGHFDYSVQLIIRISIHLTHINHFISHLVLFISLCCRTFSFSAIVLFNNGKNVSTCYRCCFALQ